MKKYRWYISWAIVVVALALIVVGRVAAQSTPQPRVAYRLSYAWAFHPHTLQEARDQTQLIVLATVVTVDRGEDIVVPVKGLPPNNEDRMPTQRITVQIAKVYRGQATVGQTISLYQTGGTTDDKHLVSAFSEDDPPYQPGERYVLLLTPGPQNSLRIISPEGRYRITPDNIVVPMAVADPNNPVVRDLRGQPLAEMERQLSLP